MTDEEVRAKLREAVVDGPFGLVSVAREIEAEIATLRAALAAAEETLERFEKWRGITARDWENGAVCAEFRDMQKKARAVRERLARIKKGER